MALLLTAKQRLAIERKFILERELAIRRARTSFFAFCCLLEPDFYTKDKQHLQDLCNTLQQFIEDRLINPKSKKPYQKFRLSMPPRHGKSRTLINLARWWLGRNMKKAVITASYNNDAAQDFSKYTRDGIMQSKNLDYEVIYSDVFPEARVKKGTAAYDKWALEGSHFSYMGAGVGGSVTGKGAHLLIVDDIIKDAEQAFNVRELDKTWLWYTGTFLSRQEPGCKQIINFTRWSEDDIIGRIQKTNDADNWYNYVKPAYDEETGLMLCDSILSREKYDWYSDPKNFNPIIFAANYKQQPPTIEGRLYNQFLLYDDLPKNIERIINYTDLKQKGKDYYCSINAAIKDGTAYILNVIYTDKPLDKNLQKKTAAMLNADKVDRAYFESNNGGDIIGDNVQELLRTEFKNNKTKIETFHQGSNKETRLLSKFSDVEYNVRYPRHWDKMFPEFYDIITRFAIGMTPDDGPDALTGITEKMNIKTARLMGL